jgi:hypothetical protein
MSLRAMTWATELRGLKAIQFRLLLVLAHHHNHITGACYPSQETLAEECEISIRSVHEHLGVLETRGLITRSRRIGAEGQCAGTNYTLALENSQPANPAGWKEDGEETPHQPANPSEPNRQLFAGSNEPGIKTDLPPKSPYAELGYLDPAEGSRPVHNRREPDVTAGLPGWQGDPGVRARAVAVEGEPWVRSYLDPAEVLADGRIVARTGIALTKLSGSVALKGLAVISASDAQRLQALAKAPATATATAGGP